MPSPTKLRDLIRATLPVTVWDTLKRVKAAVLARKHAKESTTLARRRAADFYRVYYKPQVDRILPNLLERGETSNFIYDLSEYNMEHLAASVGCAVEKTTEEITAYIREAIADSQLRAAAEMPSDIRCGFGRRLGWYAVARAIKPKVIVETGVERGHGSLILCAALLRNAAEGNPGRYFGTDLNPIAGRLLKGRYAEVGKILYGDSIESLRAMDGPIDLFINDSDHSAEYEYREYQTVRNKLSPKAIILGDNAHVTNKLITFSRETGRRFLFFKEQPENHWYPGAGIGISFPLSAGHQ
jgi:predicted O-methyltransferase YrrM